MSFIHRKKTLVPILIHCGKEVKHVSVIQKPERPSWISDHSNKVLRMVGSACPNSGTRRVNLVTNLCKMSYISPVECFCSISISIIISLIKPLFNTFLPIPISWAHILSNIYSWHSWKSFKIQTPLLKWLPLLSSHLY